MTRMLGTAGVLGGLMWITIAFYPARCAPITPASEVFCNRLWSPALLGIFLGFAGLFLRLRGTHSGKARNNLILLPAGFALMLLGNFVEYWLLNDFPHEGSGGWARGLSWMTVLLGLLVVLVSSTRAGYLGIRSRSIPGWLGIVLVLLFPVTLAAGYASLHFVGIPVGIASTAAGVFTVLVPGETVKKLPTVE